MQIEKYWFLTLGFDSWVFSNQITIYKIFNPFTGFWKTSTPNRHVPIRELHYFVIIFSSPVSLPLERVLCHSQLLFCFHFSIQTLKVRKSPDIVEIFIHFYKISVCEQLTFGRTVNQYIISQEMSQLILIYNYLQYMYILFHWIPVCYYQKNTIDDVKIMQRVFEKCYSCTIYWEWKILFMYYLLGDFFFFFFPSKHSWLIPIMFFK